ncbi:hypothetical protein NSQ26_07945 [Bacillus sp. FSL W7-1360]
MKSPLARGLFLGVILVNFAFAAMLPVLPAFSSSLGGLEIYGTLMAVIGLGAVVGAAMALCSNWNNIRLASCTLFVLLDAGWLGYWLLWRRLRGCPCCF